MGVSVVRDEHWFQDDYHSLDREQAKEAIHLAKEKWLIQALNQWFGHSKWSLKDVGGQASHRYPLGPEGPTVVQFRGEDILQIDPPVVKHLLVGFKGRIQYTIRYEFLGKAAGAGLEAA